MDEIRREYLHNQRLVSAQSAADNILGSSRPLEQSKDYKTTEECMSDPEPIVEEIEPLSSDNLVEAGDEGI